MHPNDHDPDQKPATGLQGAARRVPRSVPLGGLHDEELAHKAPVNLREAAAMATGPRVEAQEPEDDLEDQPEDTEPGFPEWALIPPGLTFPRGKKVYVLRFRAEWTDTPSAGDRQCIVWGLTYNDEKNALKRAREDAMRTIGEYSIAMIRAIDGERVDLTTAEGRHALDRWWEVLGQKCRTMLQAHYIKTHNLTDAQRLDFFANCVAEVGSG